MKPVVVPSAEPAAVETPPQGRRFSHMVLERPVLTVFLVALVVRVVAAISIWLIWNGTIFGDEGTYSEMATAVVEGRTGAWDEYTRWLYWDTATWTLPLTGVYALLTPNVLVGQLLSAVAGATAAAVTARLAREALSVGWAVLAGLFVAFFPSQVLWSSLTLKDAAVWSVAACVGLAVARVTVVQRGRAVAWAAVLIISLTLMAFLRTHTFVTVTWAAAIAVALTPPRRPFIRVASSAVLLIAVPWVLGLGPAASGFIFHEVDTVASRRLANAVGATTAVVDVPISNGLEGQASGGDPDRRDPLGESSLRHLPRGLVLMLLDPLPEMVSDNPRVRLAATEHVLWYPLLLLALSGLPAVWVNRRVLAYPLLVGAATTVVYALSEGNFGTAYRHRGEIVWVVSLLAAFGARQHWVRFRERQGQTT